MIKHSNLYKRKDKVMFIYDENGHRYVLTGIIYKVNHDRPDTSYNILSMKINGDDDEYKRYTRIPEDCVKPCPEGYEQYQCFEIIYAEDIVLESESPNHQLELSLDDAG